jgi:hypothetical protein
MNARAQQLTLVVNLLIVSRGVQTVGSVQTEIITCIQIFFRFVKL